MRKPLLAALLALVVGGCMVGPDYVRPPIDTPTAWRLSDQDARDLANTAWWEQFGDPVLNELVSAALLANKDLLIASARIEEFAGQYGFVRSALFPQVGAGYEVSRQKGVAPGASTSSTYNNYQAVLNASWEIDIWGRIRRQTEAARAQLLASEDGRRAVILSLVGSVAGAYVNLRDLDRQLEIARATAKKSRRFVRDLQGALRGWHHLVARTESEPVPVRGSSGHHPGHREVDRTTGERPERVARSQPRADYPRQEHRSTVAPGHSSRSTRRIFLSDGQTFSRRSRA
jgi:hypothetical protein